MLEIPDKDHFARHCPKQRFQEGKASPEAFALRPKRRRGGTCYEADTFLSGCWMEYRECDIGLICSDIPLSKRPGDVLLILSVRDIRQVRAPTSQRCLDVKHQPDDPKNPDSHSGIHGYVLAENEVVGRVLRRLVKGTKPIPV